MFAKSLKSRHKSSYFGRGGAVEREKEKEKEREKERGEGALARKSDGRGTIADEEPWGCNKERGSAR